MEYYDKNNFLSSSFFPVARVIIKALRLLIKMLTDLKEEFAKNRQIYLKIKAIPGASKTEAKAVMADGTIKIAVAAAPEKGRANAALIEFLAEEFLVSRDSVRIISGAGARVKLIRILRN